MKTKTLNQISQEKYGKDYNHLPDDGAEQDFVQGEYSRLNQVKPACGDLSEHDALVAVAEAAEKWQTMRLSVHTEQLRIDREHELHLVLAALASVRQ